jgi:hypothetical protein
MWFHTAPSWLFLFSGSPIRGPYSTDGDGSKDVGEMPDTWSQLGRIVSRSVMVLIAASLLLVPVRCDASPLPHSLFVDPMVEDSSEHEMAHHTNASTSAREPLPEEHSHSAMGTAYGDLIEILSLTPSMAGEDVDAIEASLQPATPPAIEPEDTSTTEADPSTMDPMGSMVDAPYAVSMPAVPGGAVVAVRRVIATVPNPVPLDGLVHDPVSPPPRLAA